MRFDDAAGTILAVQEATLLPELWPDALARLADICRASTVLGQMVGDGSYDQICNRGREDVAREYVETGWSQWNPRMERGMALTRRGASGLITGEMMFSPEELARDRYFHEFAIQHDITSFAGLVAASHGASNFVLTIERGETRGAFADRELADMNLLVGHVANAFSFALRLKMATAASILQTLEAQGQAMAMLTAGGHVLSMTERFEKLLGSRLRIVGGHLRAAEPSEDGLLQALVARVARSDEVPDEPIGPIILRRDIEHPLAISALPVAGSARDIFGLARVILEVDDLAAARAGGSEPMLRELFGLTSAEARLAARIGRGETLREAADADGVTLETMRTRLKTIFSKTGSNRQLELALLVNRLTR